MINIFSTILFILLTKFCVSQDTVNSYKVKYYSEKIQNYLDKEKKLSAYYSINKEGIKMYASSVDKTNHKAEFSISFGQTQNFLNRMEIYSPASMVKIYSSGKYNDVYESIYRKEPHPTSQQKLSGYKIAIDAGHTAGNMETGGIEQKCLKFKCDSLKGLKESIAISEGMLTFATATLLKNKLQAEGAEVFMTRNFNGGSAYGVPFDNWLKKKHIDSLYAVGLITIKQKNILLNPKTSKKDKFRFVFKDLELQKRAEIINNYKPDFTIIIHYNADETNTGWTKPANKNFNMTFVGGAFMRNDLSTPEKRFEFLRLLISDDLEESIALSSAMVKSFEKNLSVKTATITDAKYLVQGCLPTEEVGVYCRNLQLTRYIYGPLVYGETLYQDNINECVLLNKECDKTKNERVQQVAEAYFQGVLNYIKK